MTVRITYTRVGSPYSSMIVGCPDCGRRLHVDRRGGMRRHNKVKGELCSGSYKVANEFTERLKSMGLA